MKFAGIGGAAAMAARFLALAAALASGAASAQTPPATPAPPDGSALPALPGNPGVDAALGARALGASHRQPGVQDLPQNGAAAPRMQGETDELYQEIMRAAAPPPPGRQ